jgi:hypothetical protein
MGVRQSLTYSFDRKRFAPFILAVEAQPFQPIAQEGEL